MGIDERFGLWMAYYRFHRNSRLYFSVAGIVFLDQCVGGNYDREEI